MGSTAGRYAPVYAFVLSTVFVVALSCAQKAVGPAEVSRELLRADGSWTPPPGAPEEELFGTVFFTPGQRLTNGTGFVIKLFVDPSVPSGCIFSVVDRVCRTSDTMPVLVGGSTSRYSTMWGWYDDLDTQNNNPCNPTTEAANRIEWHDFDQDGITDGLQGGGLERHCIKTGRYRVELWEGTTLRKSRTVDHVRAVRVAALRNLPVEDPGATDAADTFVHFVLFGNLDVNSNDLAIDDPATQDTFDVTASSALRTHTRYRFASRAKPAGWSLFQEVRGRILYRVNPDLDAGTFARTAYYSHDYAIRTFSYAQTGPYRANSEVSTPTDASDNAQRFSSVRNLNVTLTGSPDPPPPPVNLCVDWATRNYTWPFPRLMAFIWCLFHGSPPTTDQEYRLAFGDGTVSDWTSAQDTVFHTYPSSGNYTATLEVRQITLPSNSATDSIPVEIPPLNLSTAAGNSFPPDMYAGQLYAVSLSMDNSGETSWNSAGGYNLMQVVPGSGDWTPWTVNYGSSGTPPGQRKTFSFNIRENSGVWGVSSTLYYKVARTGATFGDSNGRSIQLLDPAGCVKNCGLAFNLDHDERTYPGGAVAEGPTWISGDTLQTLSIPNYRLHFTRVGNFDVAHIRYFGALAEPWDVDATLRIVFEPGTVNPGLIRRGIATSGYGVEVIEIGPGEVTVRLKRLGGGEALPRGENLLLEIPIVAVPGRPLRQSLPLVELTVSR